MLDPHSPAFNTGEYLEILGPVDLELFKTALRQCVTEADALHLRVLETDDGPRQYLTTDPDWRLPVIDVSAEVDPRAAAKAWMHDDMASIIDLTCGPLFSFALFRAAPKHFLWYSRYHYLCNDGVGMVLIAQRVAALYTALTEGRPSETEILGSWVDLLDDEQNYERSAQYVRDQEYWREQLANPPEPVTLSGRSLARYSASLPKSSRNPTDPSYGRRTSLVASRCVGSTAGTRR